MNAAAFDPLRILKALHRHDVRFVIIGGIAGRLWGSTTVTNDLDVCYSRDRANLQSLARALRDLKAKGDMRLLESADRVAFVTTAGNFDCIGTPAGTTGYEQLARTATSMNLGEITAPVAAIEDLILMKRASARPKDLVEVQILAAVRDEIERER